MNYRTQIGDNLGGDDNFWAWKYKISLILEENDLDKFISGDVLEPEGYEVKDAQKRSMDTTKRIIAYSIKDQLILHVSAFKTSNKVYDALTKMFEGNNINWKMTLRNQLKNVKIQTLTIYSLTSQGLLKSNNNLKKLKKMSKKEKL